MTTSIYGRRAELIGDQTLTVTMGASPWFYLSTCDDNHERARVIVLELVVERIVVLLLFHVVDAVFCLVGISQVAVAQRCTI